MRQALLNQLPSSYSINSRLSVSALNNISSRLRHPLERQCSKSCKALLSSGNIPHGRNIRNCDDYHHDAIQVQQQQQRSLSAIPIQYTAPPLENNDISHSAMSPSSSFEECDWRNNHETISEVTEMENSSACEYDIIDPELQHMRIGRKNIEGLIVKLTQDYPLGSAPAQYTDLSIDAIEYCLKPKKKSGRANEISLQNAIKLIFWLISEYGGGNPHATFNTERTLNPLLDAGRIRSRPQEFCSVAVELLSALCHLAEHDPYDEYSMDLPSSCLLPAAMMPNLKTYNMVLDTISKSKRRDAPSLIQSIITQMSSTASSQAAVSTADTDNIPDITPDTISYNTLLYALSQQQSSSSPPHIQSNNNKKTPSPAHECEAILRSLPHTLTDTISYNIVLHAWSRASQSDPYAAPRAEQLLRDMQELSNEPAHPSFVARIKPNYISFTTVITAWGNSRDLDAAERAEEIYRLMESMAFEGGMDDLRPNVRTLNAVLNAYAKSAMPGAARRAEDLLMEAVRRCDDMGYGNSEGAYTGISVVPGTVSFSICIKAWANSDERGASKHTLDLLHLMQELDGTPVPTSNVESSTSFHSRPDVGTFNSVLRSLANDDGSFATKAKTADRVLEWMEDSGLRPDLQTYNMILRCCCTTKPTIEDDDRKEEVKQHAVLLATRILSILRRTSGQRGGVTPDPYTFNFFIKVCDRLCDNNEEKFRLIDDAFPFCIEMGQFSNPVLSILKNTLGRDKVKKVLRMDKDDCRSVRDLQVDDFPREWSCGMKQRSSRDMNGNTDDDARKSSSSQPSTLRRIARR